MYVSNPTDKYDWSVSENYRFVEIFHLHDGNLLPDPAGVGENDAYVFNQPGIDAIK